MLCASEIRIGTGMHNSSGKLGIRVGQTLIFSSRLQCQWRGQCGDFMWLSGFEGPQPLIALESGGKLFSMVANGCRPTTSTILGSQSTALLIKRLLLPLPQSATPSSQTVGPFLSPWWGTISIKSRNSAHSNSHLPSPSDHCWTPSLKVAPLV